MGTLNLQGNGIRGPNDLLDIPGLQTVANHMEFVVGIKQGKGQLRLWLHTGSQDNVVTADGMLGAVGALITGFCPSLKKPIIWGAS